MKTYIITFTLILIGFASFSQKNENFKPDQGITNDVHKKYAGQIVWSDEKISFTSPDESTFKTEFDASMYIFGRMYLPYSFENMIIAEHEVEKADDLLYYFNVYVDGKLNDWEIKTGHLSGDYVQRTTQQVWLYLPPDDKYNKVNVDWAKLINSLEPGTHDIKVVLKIKAFKNEVTSISGSFKYKKEANEVVKRGKAFSDFEAGMSNPQLEEKILKSAQAYGKAKYLKESFIKVKIKSSDWNIIYHQKTGAVLGRYVVAYCYATWPDGHCTVEPLKFKQEFIGTGFTDNVKFYYTTVTYDETIDCD